MMHLPSLEKEETMAKSDKTRRPQLTREQREHTEALLRTLTTREEKVLRMRFGLLSEDEATRLKELEEVRGIARERLRQIEAKALRKLRHPSRSKRLKAFLEGDTAVMPDQSKKEDT